MVPSVFKGLAHLSFINQFSKKYYRLTLTACGRIQLMSSCNLVAMSRGLRVGGVKNAVDNRQSPSLDLSQPGNVLAIII